MAGPVTESLPIDGRSLTLEQFLAVVDEGCAVSLAPEARQAVDQARRAVERAVARGRPIYGVSTGFGALAGRSVAPAELRRLQIDLLRSHASGSGPPLDAELVRGMILLRANSLAAGHSGVRAELVERLLDLLNRRLVPWVPSQGSVGASGDLAPLAHMGLTLVGEGRFLEPPTPGASGLPTPLELAEKEGVALINGTSLMASYLALGLRDLGRLLDAARIGAALAFDALRGDPQSLDDRLGELRRLPEQREEARELRSLLAGSGLAVPRATYEGQDPYTLRCLPQVFAAVRLAERFGREIAERELNAVTDNPVVFEGDEFLSGGNFHGQQLALALDTLAIATSYLAGFSERRIARLLDPSKSRGLPAFLVPPSGPGGASGLMLPQYLAAALVNENQTLVHPASASSLPTSADQEDFVSMGPWAGAKLRHVVANTRTVLAVEWIVAGQALELRRPSVGGRGSEAALRALRELVAPWAADRSPQPDIARVGAAIAEGALLRKVRSAVPKEIG